MTPLWDRGEPVDHRVLRLAAGRDPELDLELVAHDALASAAHATMLERIGVLSADELAALRPALREIVRDSRAGELTIAPEEEDCHTAIENRLTAAAGDAGRRIHTGRSRNDQVIAALRLWARERLLEIGHEVVAVARRLLARAEEERETGLPGYSHTRQAMPSTLGHLFAAHAEGLADDLPWIRRAYEHVDRSPLGSASGFGVALPLDRELVSRLLGFARPQVNTLAVQNDRGKSEYLVLGAAAAVALDLGRLAADLIWYSSDELGFLALADRVTTGSSIMPQKRNPDLLEVLRAGAGRVRSRQSEVGAISGTLSSGYHRDLQLTKEPLLDGLRTTLDGLAVARLALDGLTVDRERCRQAVRRATGATDAVYRRVAGGEPFRAAYRAVAADPEAAVEGEVVDAWRERRHLGAPGALDPAWMEEELARETAWLDGRRAAAEEVWRWFDGGG